MKGHESRVLIETIQCFVAHKFMFLDGKRMTADGIANALAQYSPDRFSGVIWRANTGALKSALRFVQFGIAGCPDIIGFTKQGKFIACECKSEDGTLSWGQRMFRDSLHESGSIVFISRSWEDTDKELKFNGF